MRFTIAAALAALASVTTARTNPNLVSRGLLVLRQTTSDVCLQSCFDEDEAQDMVEGSCDVDKLRDSDKLQEAADEFVKCFCTVLEDNEDKLKSCAMDCDLSDDDWDAVTDTCSDVETEDNAAGIRSASGLLAAGGALMALIL
jgi:hypothetical protein